MEKAMEIKYPKPIMSRSELMELGIPRGMLEIAYADPNQTFAQKVNPANPHSKVVYITEGFEAWRKKRFEMEMKARR